MAEPMENILAFNKRNNELTQRIVEFMRDYKLSLSDAIDFIRIENDIEIIELEHEDLSSK